MIHTRAWRRQAPVWLFAGASLVASLQTRPLAAQEHAPPDAVLKSDRTIQGELSPGQTRSYAVTVGAGELLEVRVEQTSREILATLRDADQKEVDSAALVGNRPAVKRLTIIAPSAGDYRIEIRPGKGVDGAAGYSLAISPLRRPLENDRKLEEARVALRHASDLIHRDKYDDALELANQAIAVRETVLGPDSTMVADALHVLANVYDNKGDYAKAEPINLRALSIRESVLGPDHPDVARSLYNLAWIYLVRQDYVKSEETYGRVLAIQEQAYGPDHPEVATTLNDLAILFHKRGDYDEAVKIDRRVLKIREATLGPNDPGLVRILNNLALDYIKTGELVSAEPLLLRALPIAERALGPDHRDVAMVLNDLGMVYANKGDYQAAEPLHRRALAIDEKALGPDHTAVADEVSNLAWLYEHTGEWSKVESLYKRALAIRIKARGATHSEVAESLNNLAHFYIASGTGDGPTVESMLNQAIEIFEKRLGPDHHAVGAALGNLAQLDESRKQYSEAEANYLRALSIEERALGEDHPNVVRLLGRLAGIYRTTGENERAISTWTRYSDAVEHNLEHNLPIGSERQKLDYVKLFASDLDDVLSFRPTDPSQRAAADRLALITVLRRKGRVLDAMTDNLAQLRRRGGSDEQTLLRALSEARSRLAAVTLAGPGGPEVASYRARVVQTKEEVDKLESEVSAKSAEFRSQSRHITIDAVQSAIPPASALVEFALYRQHPADTVRPLNDLEPRTPTAGTHTAAPPARYIAFLLFPEGEPQRIELGEAAAVDRIVAKWRDRLRDPRRADVVKFGRILDEEVLRPLRARLGSTERLFVSPDGALNLIPFAALVDDRGKFIAERYTITYLTSGRDLLRLQEPRTARTSAVVLANPDFGDPAVKSADGGARVDTSQLFFGPLPGTAKEADGLRQLLPDAEILTKGEATKARLESVTGPRILHVATHGFLLPDEQTSSRPGTAEAGASPQPRDRESRNQESTRLAKAAPMSLENPLLRSGLALAGANAGGASGVLTAVEAADLDLWGTKLVVLSSCDSGMGNVGDGEGVYGLRRALVLAGSETQLTTLWPVSDRGTSDFVLGYYKALLAGEERGEALREKQLSTLHSHSYRHPYYWAGFVLSGQWAGLEIP